MGFGSIIAAGITIIMLIVAGYMILAGLAYSVDSANAAQAAVRDAAGGRMHTSLAIANVTRVDDHALSFSVTNSGSTAIVNVTRMDVFVMPASGGRITGCEYLPFLDEATSGFPDHWFVSGHVKEGVGGSFMLKPGDRMVIQCEFAVQLPDNPVGYIEVAAPNGVQAYRSYKY